MRETGVAGQAKPLLQAQLKGVAGSLLLDVALDVQASWTVLFGPSGAGKSTVLRALCGLTAVREQHVVLAGSDLTRMPAHRRRIAMVAQQPALFPHLTAQENVVFALLARADVSRRERAAEALRLLRRFRAEGAATKYPGSLSGGELQRVALARAIAPEPRLLLLDEAFSGLQTELRAELVDEIRRWQAGSGVPVLSVTHDVGEALACAEEVLRMSNGRIVRRGLPLDVLAEELASLREQLG